MPTFPELKINLTDVFLFDQNSYIFRLISMRHCTSCVYVIVLFWFKIFHSSLVFVFLCILFITKGNKNQTG